MTPEAQRIAIAEACGLKDIKHTKHEKLDLENRSIVYWSGLTGIPPGFTHYENRIKIPDYLNDLNGMHEAENGLTEDLAEKFCAWLLKLNGYKHDRVVSCTAIQRAEAFLRTLGKWEEASK